MDGYSIVPHWQNKDDQKMIKMNFLHMLTKESGFVHSMHSIWLASMHCASCVLACRGM